MYGFVHKAINWLGSNSLDLEDEELRIKQDLSEIKVLLVEDDALNQMIARTTMEEPGIDVATAANGEVAVDMLRANTYDVILMDMQMPVKAGIEATRIIRDELQLKIPIIAVTANVLKGDKEKFMDAGMDEYLSKPFKLLDLKIKIANFTARCESIADPSPIRDFTSKETSSKLCDLSFLQEVSDGNNEFAVKMIKGFLEHTPDSLKKITLNAENKQWERVRAIAHRIKPSIDFMGINSLKEDIRLIEEYSQEPVNPAEIMILTQRLKKVCEEAMTQLREELTQL